MSDKSGQLNKFNKCRTDISIVETSEKTKNSEKP